MEAGYQTPSEESLVILKYLEGKSMDKIVNETKISKGKVHYIIKDWKNKLGTASADQIIDFTRLVKKSGITVEQCTEGFRMINILKDLGIEYNSGFTDGENQDDDDDDGLIFFIEQIYTNCKKLRIPPAIIPLWIKDLLDFQTFITMDKTDGHQDQYNISIQESYIQKKEQQNLEEINTPIDIREEAEFKSIIGNKKSGQDIEYPASDFNFNQTEDSSFSSKIKIPFISQVSFFISQKKKELEKLTENQKNIKKNIYNLKQQENKTKENLNKIFQNERLALSYLNLFSRLEQSLKQNYSINIRDDIQNFSRLINDFKEK